MYGLHQELCRERQQEYARVAHRDRLGEQLAARLRWQRRAARARRSADRFDRAAEASARSGYALAGN